MRDSEYRKIQAQYERLVKELDLVNTSIIDCLYSKGVLTASDKDDLKHKHTDYEKNRRFLDLLQLKDDSAYQHFLDALRIPDNQSFLAELLEPAGIPRRRIARTGVSSKFVYLPASVSGISYT